jgi:hypothetical protein
MKTIAILVLISSLIANAFSQKAEFKKPDYNGIKKIIDDKNSDSYYPVLFKRYTDSDTTLNIQDFRNLYFGYLFSKSYTVYDISEFTDSLNLILKKDSLNSDDYNAIIKFEKLILDKSPFNLRDLSLSGFAHSRLGDTLIAKQIVFKLNMISGTILSTGDGRKESTAWHVISISHEYDILSILGFKFDGSQSLTKKGCDFLQVVENEQGIKGFYFDVNRILEKEREVLR